MKGSMRILFVLILAASQLAEAQRSRTATQRDTFIPLTPQQIESTVNMLGIELGQTLAEVKKTVEDHGGEVIWGGSPDPSFVRTKEYLKSGSSSYFKYYAHSTRQSSGSSGNSPARGASRAFARDDIMLTLDVYPRSDGDFKDPENLALYHVQTYLSFQPDRHQLRQAHINLVDVFFEDIHRLMETKRHFLFQSGGLLVYKENAQPSISIGDLSGDRSKWQKVLPKKFPCNKLMTLADNFPKTASGMVDSMRVSNENGQGSKIVYKPWGEIMDAYNGAGAADAYKACGNATVMQVMQIPKPDVPGQALLQSTSFSYQSADVLEDALEGFYRALYKS